MFNAQQTEQALANISRQPDPLGDVVDLAEGFAVGWVLGGLLKKLAGK